MAIARLGAGHDGAVLPFLIQDEPWSVIPFDAFLRYGMGHPEHLWFGEWEGGRLRGIIYGHKRFVYVYYPSNPLRSGLNDFLSSHYPRFSFSGQPTRAAWLIRQLPSYYAHHVDRSAFVQQSPLTFQRLQGYGKMKGEKVQVRTADRHDFGSLLNLYKDSEVAHEVDPAFLKQLLEDRRVLVAERGELVGSVMLLKESWRYALLGGLFVAPPYRNLGVAAQLGRAIMMLVRDRGKKACFYYRLPTLTSFYEKGAFLPLGLWDEIHFTSK